VGILSNTSSGVLEHSFTQKKNGGKKTIEKLTTRKKDNQYK